MTERGRDQDRRPPSAPPSPRWDAPDAPGEAELEAAEPSRRTDEPRAGAGRAGGRSRAGAEEGAAGDVGARIAGSLDRIAECLERIEGLLARSAGARREREHGGPEFRPGRRPDERREGGRDYRREGYGGGGGYQDRRGDQYRGPRDRFGGQRDRPGRRRWGGGGGGERGNR
jgi:hypothetical protein